MLFLLCCVESRKSKMSENVKVIIASIARSWWLIWSDKSNIYLVGRSFLVDQVGKIRLNNEKWANQKHRNSKRPHTRTREKRRRRETGFFFCCLLLPEHDKTGSPWLHNIIHSEAAPIDLHIIMTRTVKSLLLALFGALSAQAFAPVTVSPRIGLSSLEAVVDVDSEAAFDQTIKSAGSSLVVIDYSTTWCGPCKGAWVTLVSVFATLQYGTYCTLAQSHVVTRVDANGVSQFPHVAKSDWCFFRFLNSHNSYRPKVWRIKWQVPWCCFS